MSVALAAQLRRKEIHTMAENTGFVVASSKGWWTRPAIASWWLIFTSFTPRWRGIAKLGDHPVVGPVGVQSSTVVRPWSRISFITTRQLEDSIQPLPQQRLVERIHTVAQESPELLVGHHYTRYLGDLSGGQILKNIAQKAMNMVGTTASASINDKLTRRPSRPPTGPQWMSCPSIRRWLIGL